MNSAVELWGEEGALGWDSQEHRSHGNFAQTGRRVALGETAP